MSDPVFVQRVSFAGRVGALESSVTQIKTFLGLP